MMARRPADEATIRRLTFKLLERVEAFMDDYSVLSSTDLDRVGGILKDAAAVLGVRAKLDQEEQRAKIAVLVRRASKSDETGRALFVEFADEADEAAV